MDDPPAAARRARVALVERAFSDAGGTSRRTLARTDRSIRDVVVR
jgi:hypothetical protein